MNTQHDTINPHHAEAKISTLKKGEYIRFKPFGPVWIRGEYDRSSKKYSVIHTDDMCKERFIKGDKIVLIGFDY